MENLQYNLVLIQSAVTSLGILLTATLAYYFSQKRYTFEKLFDRKLLYLEEMYSKIISLEKDLKKYIFTTGADIKSESLPQKIEEIGTIQAKFFELQEYFWKKEIALDEYTAASIESLLSVSIEILSNLHASIVSQKIDDPKTSWKQWNDAYQIMKDKLSISKIQLKKDFRKVVKNQS